MKTNKKSNLLLYAVIAVWLAIGVRAIIILNPSMPELEQQEFVANTNIKLNTTIDTFSIKKVDRDPFLGTTLKKKPIKKKTKPNLVNWKPIVYHGIVKGKNNSQKIFIISIDGKQSLLKKGQTRDSITLVYGSAKTVRLRYKNQSKSFAIKQ